MSRKLFTGTAAEVVLILAAAALLGIGWNRTLLLDAWRGDAVVAQEKQQAQGQQAQGELLPMPVGLMQVKEMHDAGQAVLVDARSAESFEKEHIAGALPLPLEQARQEGRAPLLEGVAPDAVVIVYCNGFSCHDSMELGKILIERGYSSVYVFEGGLPEWRDAGYPVAGGAR